VNEYLRRVARWPATARAQLYGSHYWAVKRPHFRRRTTRVQLRYTEGAAIPKQSVC
jgi:hypothetical protein